MSEQSRAIERMAIQQKLQSSGGGHQAAAQGLQALSEIFMRMGMQRKEAEAAAARLKEELAGRQAEAEARRTFEAEQSDLDRNLAVWTQEEVTRRAIAEAKARAEGGGRGGGGKGAGGLQKMDTEADKQRQKILDEYRKLRFKELEEIFAEGGSGYGMPDKVTGDVKPLKTLTPAQKRQIQRALLEAQSIEDMDLDTIIGKVTSEGKKPGFWEQMKAIGAMTPQGEPDIGSLGSADPGFAGAGGLPGGLQPMPGPPDREGELQGILQGGQTPPPPEAGSFLQGGPFQDPRMVMDPRFKAQMDEYALSQPYPGSLQGLR